MFYRREFFLVLDTPLLLPREETEKIESAFRPLLDALCPTQHPTYEKIEKLCQIYHNDLPHPRLVSAESEMFIPFFRNMRNAITSQMLRTYRYAADLALHQSHIGLFPMLARTYKRLTSAPTVCKDEKSFSKLKFVKSTCRNSMGNKRLDALTLLSCEKDLAEKVDLRKLTNVWSAGVKHRRIKLI